MLKIHNKTVFHGKWIYNFSPIAILYFLSSLSRQKVNYNELNIGKVQIKLVHESLSSWAKIRKNFLCRIAIISLFFAQNICFRVLGLGQR